MLDYGTIGVDIDDHLWQCQLRAVRIERPSGQASESEVPASGPISASAVLTSPIKAPTV